MKLLKFSICIAIAAMLFAGCVEEKGTGLVFVDHDAAEKTGLVVTNFTDNPFTATIKYDYSQIPNFSTENISVTLVRYVIPKEDWKAKKLFGYTERQIQLQKKLDALSTVDNTPITSLRPKTAKIKENKPGYLKISSIDDIGAYQIEYKSKKQ